MLIVVFNLKNLFNFVIFMAPPVDEPSKPRQKGHMKACNQGYAKLWFDIVISPRDLYVPYCLFTCHTV